MYTNVINVVIAEFNNMLVDLVHFLQSDVPIDLLDVEKNSAVVSYSACNPEVSLLCLHFYIRINIQLCQCIRFDG